jgi:hypothetical protein
MTSDKMTKSFHQEILQRLGSVQAKQLRIALLNGSLVCAFIACFLIVDAVALERAFTLGVAGRTILFIVTVLGIAASLLWFVGRPLLRMVGVLQSSSMNELALTVGRYFPHIRDRILNAIQVFESQNQPRALYSLELIDASFADLYRDVQSLNFLDAVDTSLLKRMKKLTAYAFGIFLLVFVISPAGFLDSTYRIVNFNRTFAASLPIHFTVEPGNIEVVRGSTVPVMIHAEGKEISNIVLRTRQQGQIEFESRDLRSVHRGGSTSVFRDSMPSIKSTTEYFVEAENVKSDKFKISVVDRPLIRSFRVHLQHPSYTRLPVKWLDENIGDVSALPGTIVSINLSSSKELAAAQVVFSDKSTLDMNVERTNATVRFPLTKERSYRIVLRDHENLTNADPIEYHLKIIPDVPPTVSVVVPGKNVDVTEQMALDMLIRITDDFGFSKLRLAHRLAQSRYERPTGEFSFVEIPLPSKELTTQELWHRWDLAKMRLVPEDIVAYYVEVFDNDNVNGPKSARSETYLVRLPSLDEVFRDVAQSQTQSLELLQSAHRDLQQIKRQMDEMRNEMKSTREKADWQQQKKAEEMQRKFEELRKKLEETVQKLDENMQKMQENKLLSQETLEKYLELQKLMEEFNAPELREALKQLQEAMKLLSPDQIREAMQKLQMTEELFRKSLERTIELLKRIAIEQKLDELVKRSEDLIKRQEELQQRTAQTDPSNQKRLEELARQQQELQKQLEAIQRELADLRKKMEEFPTDMPLDEIQKAQQELDRQKLDEQMKNAAQQMRSGQMNQAQSSQRRIAQGMQQFLEQMQAAQKSLRENQQRQVLNEMRRMLQSMIELSKRQEELKAESQQLDPNSQRFRENAGKQMEVLGDLANVTNNLTQLSRKTFAITPEMGREIGRAMQQMSQAMQSMEQRNPGGTSQAQTEAMGSLNRAAMMMQGAMNAMQGGGGMGMAGLMQQLQQMSGMQAGINAQTQSMMGEGQGMTQQQAAEWSRLAGEQGAVRKALEDLAREAEQAGELSKLLGDLNRIAEEMREVQTDMEQNNVNPETMKKQERILSRLLDSQRSMRERDYEKRRRAEAGKNVVRQSPGEIDLTTQEGRSRLRQELLKVLEQRYAKDYEELIRRYFESLEKEEVQ